MLIVNKKELAKYSAENRLWQGIPSIEVTKKGRIFCAFYSGGTKEEIGNYTMLVKSDNGEEFSEPIAVADEERHRCFDPCLWIDPLERLWFTWSMTPDHGTYGVICDAPDADTLVWSDIFFIGHDVMMNKPTVLSTGEWIFPIAVWNNGVRALPSEFDSPEEKGSFVYRSIDNGKTFEKIGRADVEKRSFDEHMVLEHSDGTLAMYVRTFYGIGVSYSFDGGKIWSSGEDSNLGGPSSRFFIRRLKSGRILLINHESSEKRNNLTAFLSEDEGKTWKYKLLIDERMNVSYPDAKEAEDGFIYITYDRERGALLNSLDSVYASAREIIYSRITEKDIIAGNIITPGSKLKRIVSKLGKYADEGQNPYEEYNLYSDAEFAEQLVNKYPDQIVDKIFEYYSVNCVNMHKIEFEKFDALVSRLENDDSNKMQIVTELISIVRSVSEIKIDTFPLIEVVKKIIIDNQNEDLTVKEIAEQAGISMYYMMHQFRKITGTTITEYRTSLKIYSAKKMLLQTNKSISEIAQECGFGSSSYFSKLFMRNVHVSPIEYRKLLQNNEK